MFSFSDLDSTCLIDEDFILFKKYNNNVDIQYNLIIVYEKKEITLYYSSGEKERDLDYQLLKKHFKLREKQHQMFLENQL